MTCQINHVHTAACNHLPGLPNGAEPNVVDDPGHTHDIAWTFVRMLILVIPIALFALGIPNSGFSKERQLKMAGSDVALDPETLKKLAADLKRPENKVTYKEDGTRIQILTSPAGVDLMREITSPSGEVKLEVIPAAGITMTFNELNEAAFDADKRKSYAGQTAILEGRFRRLEDKEFTLFRLKMTCCGSDAVPLKVRIIAPYALGDRQDFEWVRVTGMIQFVKAPGQERYTPVLILADNNAIETVPVRNEYEF
jgi:hypothetical protein